MRTLANALRLVALIAVVAAIVAQFIPSSRSPEYSPFNFFGYFTIQSNILIAVAWGIALVLAARGRRNVGWATTFRGAATVYIATTGIVYNTLLTGASVENTVVWSNAVLHQWIPLYAVVDWLVFSDHGKLLMRKVWLFLIYPAVWLVVVLVRGATDGWVPYPFLDPSLGYGVVALYCLGVALFIGLMGVLVVGMTRVRLLRV